jgi:hypothetical protein
VGCSPGSARLKRLLFHVPVRDDQGRGLRDLEPGARQVGERLRDDAVALTQLLEALVVGMEPAHGIEVRGYEERARVALRRVADGPQTFTVGDPNRHLHRVLDPVLAALRLDVRDRPLHRPQRILFESGRERQVEEQLRVGRSGDPEEERRIDLQQQVSPHGLEAPDQPVVNEQPAAVAERMAIRLLDGTPHRGANVSYEERGLDVVRELAQVEVVQAGFRLR